MNIKGVEELYSTDRYIENYPSLHAQDSSWKVAKIIPMLDLFINNHCDKDKLNILDVGGGAGLILKSISSYIQECYGIKVNKFALDLSPGALRIQKENNPDIKGLFNEDIAHASVKDKEMDLVLMIDVIEHLSKPSQALRELRRISHFIIFKVPLEDCIYLNIRNFLSRGKLRKQSIETRGHINIYDLNKIKKQVEGNVGAILQYCYTNVFSYYLSSGHYSKEEGLRGKLYSVVGSLAYRLSPKLCSYIFPDFVMLLVKAK